MVIIQKSYLFTFIALLIVFLSFCSSSNDVGYFPMKVGMKWEYSVKAVGARVGTIEGNAIIRIDGTETIQSKKYFKVITVFSGLPGAETDISYYRIGKAGQYVIHEGYKDRNEELYIPMPLEIGKIWTMFSPLEDEFLEFSCEIKGFETLHTINGTYENCLLVSREVKYSGDKIKSKAYYAPGVGQVKAIVEYPFGSIMELNLIKLKH